MRMQSSLGVHMYLVHKYKYIALVLIYPSQVASDY